MDTAITIRSEDRFDDLQHYDHEDLNYCSLTNASEEGVDSPPTGLTPIVVGHRTPQMSVTMEHEKRMRREIANSNERRRMQSINAGFQNLRTLIPHHEGEKLSKAAILQHTADYIYQLEQEKTRLLSQNCQLKRLVSKQEGELLSTASVHKKRKIDDSTGVVILNTNVDGDNRSGALSPDNIQVIGTSSGLEDGGLMIDEVAELRAQLEREQSLRVELEEQVKVYSARLGEVFVDPKTTTDNTQTTIQYHHNTNTCVVGEEAGMEIIEVNESDNLVIQREPEEDTALVKTELTVTPEDDRLNPVKDEAVPQQQQVLPSARVYLTSTSRQNLETIVEAIRHLEGDHLFSDDHQEAPLALTKHAATSNQKLLKVEMNPFLQFHSGSQTPQGTTVVTSNSPVRPSRPGVIVGKQAS
ncbi:transcription factor AP-4 isoform X1 [Metopolophium dirhodum]|uniref:transcription factor AP-4 isoform X1 n=1 Tax=Metopolophium dirhodum TaxID=44670 RepID=UPI00298FB0B6|nr:transcription factor AP-4 isoform X1 [Metopolophium dirhodum]